VCVCVCVCFFLCVNLTPCYFSGFVCCVHKLSLSLVTCRYRKRIEKMCANSTRSYLGGIWRWAVSFTPVTLAERERERENLPYPLEGSLGLISRSDVVANRRIHVRTSNRTRLVKLVATHGTGGAGRTYELLLRWIVKYHETKRCE